MDRGARQVTVHMVAKSWTRLRQFSSHPIPTLNLSILKECITFHFPDEAFYPPFQYLVA